MTEKQSIPPFELTAAGGVVYLRSQVNPSDIRVLTILRNGIWDLPKGKVESGEMIAQAAVREVVEETGIPEPQLGDELGVTMHTYELNGQTILKETHWYAMQLRPVSEGRDGEMDANLSDWHNDKSKGEWVPESTPQLEEGVTKVEWMSLSEAMAAVGFENLRLVLEWFSRWWQETGRRQ